MAGQRVYKCLKYSLLFTCTVIFLSGILLISIGAWIRYGAVALVDLMGDYSVQLVNLSYICMAMGGIVSLTSLTGCAGACKDNRCFLTMFFIVMVMWLVAQAVGIVVIMVYHNSVGVMVHSTFKDSLKKVYLGVSAADPISSAWNVVMKKFQCCGLDNTTTDFVGSTFTQTTGLAYPTTCCANLTSPSCDGFTIMPGLIHSESCFEKVINVIKKESMVLGASVGGMGFIEIASMVFSMTLFMKLGSMRYEVRVARQRAMPQTTERIESLPRVVI
ncbi:tetraspanin-16-like [Engraulis encrasicolus]|uniref:tetraspanin-16-like n=1 Tax=Engraulis encrasicolus TaxID=184585 RepID=UPI002FD171C8